ncbi:unnamed protein product [Ectocarpus sp. 8 AP-2014]
MEEERQPQDPDNLVVRQLKELEPGKFWLTFASIERVLELDSNTLVSFVESMKPQKIGSTRRQTLLSPARNKLEGEGIFFRPGHVARCSVGDTMPSWQGGPRYAEIGDPVRKGATDDSTLGNPPPSPSISESSYGASPTYTTPTCDQRSPLTHTSEIGEEEKSPDNEGRESGSDVLVDDVPGADPDSEDESMTDVREVGRPESTASPSPGVSPPTGQALLETDATTEWSEEIATNVVFQALISTNTWNCFVEASDLAQLVDHDETEVRRVLKERKGERRYPAYTMFLRSFGIIPNPHNKKTHWCLVGLGSLHLALKDCHHRDYVISAEPKGPTLSASTALQAEVPKLPEGCDLLELGMDFTEFNSDVRRQVKCRRCSTSVPDSEWWYVRRESVASVILNPGVEADVGLAFRCECNALHIGEPLPTRASTGSAWTSADTVVKVWGSTCPVVEHGPSQSLTGGTRGGGTADPFVTPGVTRRVTPSSGKEGGTGSGARGAPRSAPSTSFVLKQHRRIEAVTSVHEAQPAQAERNNHVGVPISVTGLLKMLRAVHYKSCGCRGELINPSLGAGRSDFDTFSAECQLCGAVFGHLSVQKPDSRALSLGCLLAGSSFQHVEMSQEMGDVQSPTGRTLRKHIEEIVVAVDEVWEDVFKQVRENIKNEPGRRTVEIPIEKHFFAHHMASLLEELKQHGVGVKEGAIDNTTYPDIATGIIASRTAKGEAPGFQLKDGKVVATLIDVSFDGSHRNRNYTSHAVNVVASVKRMKPDHRGLMDSVLDQVAFGRHIGQDAPLQPLCVISRNNGLCGVHGKAEEWDRRKRTAKGASPEEEDAARRLRHANCYSSTCLRSPLSAPATEPLGIIVLCLRLMYEGFWVNAFAHDQDAGIGHIVRGLFDNALECLDRAHIQKKMKKVIINFASGHASRAYRYFAWVVREAREVVEECVDDSITLAEAFTEGFAHLVFHLQGVHKYCSSGCAGAEEHLAEEEEPRAGKVVQPDIFDIEQLRGVSEPGLGATAMPQSPIKRATPGAGGADASLAGGAEQDGAKKGEKKSLRCRGSQFTAASLRQTLDDTVSLSKVKEQLWVRCSSVILSSRTAGGTESLSESGKAMLDSFYQAVMDAKSAARRVSDMSNSTRTDLERACAAVHGRMSEKEKRTTEVPLADITGPWEPAPTEEDYTSPCDGPARLVQTLEIQGVKEAYIASSAAVMTAERNFRQETGRTLTVSVAGSSQRETYSMRHQAWSESREWTFFSHCCNGLGGHIRASQPCAACDCHTTFVTTCIRSKAFMEGLGTNFLESMNGAIAAKATKRSDFNRTHWSRAQIAMMNRTHEEGSVGVANLIRSRMRLPPLTNRAADKMEALDRRGKHVVVGQLHRTKEQTAKSSSDRYKNKDSVPARTAAYKANHDKRVKENKILPYGHGTHGVAALREKIAAEGANADGAENGESGRTSGKKKTRKRKQAGGTANPEYNAGGSNTDNNDKLVAEVRMGGTKTGGVCSSCLESGVGRHFLVEAQHARKGANICTRVRAKWDAHVASIKS